MAGWRELAERGKETAQQVFSCWSHPLPQHTATTQIHLYTCMGIIELEVQSDMMGMGLDSDSLFSFRALKL